MGWKGGGQHPTGYWGSQEVSGGPQQAPCCPAHGPGPAGSPCLGQGEPGARLPLGSMSNRRTFPSISQPPPQGTIHLHSIFTPLHVFPFQPRIIFYHQITVAIRWSRCDSEQSVCPPLFPPPPAALLLPPPPRAGRVVSKRQGVRRDAPAAGFAGWVLPVAGCECLAGGRVQVAIESGKTCGGLLWCGTLPAARAQHPLPTALLQHPDSLRAPSAPAWHQRGDTGEAAGTQGALMQVKYSRAATSPRSAARACCDESSPSPCLLQSATNESLSVQG